MGVYGPVDFGTNLEELAIAGLRSMQREKILEAVFLAQASSGAEGKHIQEAFKEYLSAIDPFTGEDIRKADEKKIKRLEEEVNSGPFGIVSLVDSKNDNITLRSKPKLRKSYAIRKSK